MRLVQKSSFSYIDAEQFKKLIGCSIQKIQMSLNINI